MKNIMTSLWILSLISLFSCGNSANSEQDGTVEISGKISNAPEGVVVLSQFTDGRPRVLDTLELDSDGSFSYELQIEDPTFYDLNLFGQRSVRLALLKEDVQVNYDFSQPENIQIEGSKDSQEMLKLEKLMADYQADVNALNEAYYEAMSNNDAETIKSIQAQALDLEANQAERVKQTINSMGDSFASLAAIGLLNPKNDFPFLDELINRLDQKYPNTLTIIQLKQQLDELRALAIGAVAPEIALPGPDGEIKKLSDLRGNYVLIDFWAAWCKPCRAENPNVVRLYKEYNSKGFEVFGVSLDRDRDDWVQAIADDQLEWTQVSDLQYFNSEAAQTYQIQAIPATYMIDPEGKIIAKDLRGPTLERKLQELFDK
ncbi:AhpC/TSA family protein [Algoriphagus kandeliae]|uniref:AhpC/TSA family protein n=1 Tax=Algoriphagus kandeliae TaxID=2562278 RepID=A0A4Y9R1Z2_9BACT|nr:TlpA disulfide reductase family protein [Algoriphagus kandeliae]TFV97386.1 AhpC/TSA family protein [Algoriphagus kandeliae]